MSDPVLMCGVCLRPVDRWLAVEEPGPMMRTFIAYCHGEKDVCRLTMRDVKHLADAIRDGRSVEAVAFTRQALNPPPRRDAALAILEQEDDR